MLSIHLRPSIHQQKHPRNKNSASLVLNWGKLLGRFSSIITRQISSYLCRASAVGKLRAKLRGSVSRHAGGSVWKRWAQAKERSSCVQIKRSSILDAFWDLWLQLENLDLGWFKYLKLEIENSKHFAGSVKNGGTNGMNSLGIWPRTDQNAWLNPFSEF